MCTDIPGVGVVVVLYVVVRCDTASYVSFGRVVDLLTCITTNALLEPPRHSGSKASVSTRPMSNVTHCGD